MIKNLLVLPKEGSGEKELSFILPTEMAQTGGSQSPGPWFEQESGYLEAQLRVLSRLQKAGTWATE